jgi:hypothetical protein
MYFERKSSLSGYIQKNKKESEPRIAQCPTALLPTYGREHRRSYTGLTHSLAKKIHHYNVKVKSFLNTNENYEEAG